MTNAPSGWKIEQAVAAWQSARANLQHQGASEAEIEEALGPETATIEDRLAALLRYSLRCKGMADAMASIIDANRARKERHERRAQEARATAFAIMETLGMSRHEWPDMTVSVVGGRARAVVHDVTALPAQYTTTEVKPRSAEILAALKRGDDVPGATLANGMPTLTVRVS
jgi:hypothetical protein